MALSYPIVRDAAADLIQAGHVVEAEGLCQVCMKYGLVFRAKATEAEA
jgi:hypothetical protein